MIVFNIDVMLAKRKMSVSELADKVGFTMANVSLLKNGKIKALKISTLNKLCKGIKRETALCQFGILPYGIFEAGEASRVASRTVRLNDYLQRILVAVCGNGHDVLKISAGLALEPKLLS